MSQNLRKMTAEEFSRRLRLMSEHVDSRFAFFLGAGCSVSSGIPDAANLVHDHWLPRLRELCDPGTTSLDKWAKQEFQDYDPKNPAASYGAVIERLFLLPEERQREVESLCDGKFPGFGYSALVNLMTMEGCKFNVVLTTNFDDLVADALYLFTRARPLVVPHESLGNYIRPTRTRPLVVKLHGDHWLSPLNTARPIADLKGDVEKRVRAVIRDRGLIFIGYGGNDTSIVQLLSALTEEALPLGVYWVSGQEPQGVIRPWLEERQAVWVDKAEFDESMLLLRDIYTLAHPDSKRFDHVFAKYAETYQALSNRISGLAESAPGSKSLKDAAKRTGESFPEWWGVEIEAERIKHTDSTKADAIYTKGLEQFPDSAQLLHSYANFLRDFRKDNVRAEDVYKRALGADPKNVELLQNYAFFLAKVRKDYDGAEELYNQALSVDPANARIVATLASFLSKMRRDPKRAEQCYRRALATDSVDPYIQASYAGFLLAQGRQQDGLQALNKVLPQLTSDQTPNLALESWFYLYANGPEESHAKTLSELKQAIKAGRRRTGLILTPNIARARQMSHPDSIWLEKLAAVINDESSLSVLDDWPAWKAA